MSNPLQQATPTTTLVTAAGTALATIRKYWTASANPPREGGTATHTRPRSRPPAHHPLVRADVVHTLTFWTQALVDEYPDALTDWLQSSAWDTLDLADVWHTTAFLEDHLTHLDHWGYLAAATKELRAGADQLRYLVDQPDKDRPPLGECHLSDDDGVHCQGTVRAVPLRHPVTGAITYEDGTCTHCKTRAVLEWWRREWGLDQELVTTRELVATLARHQIKAEPATVRWWLHKGIICASGSNEAGDRLYDVAAVVFALGKREGRARSATVGASRSPMPETSPAQVGG